jgi:hypothetical protein
MTSTTATRHHQRPRRTTIALAAGAALALAAGVGLGTWRVGPQRVHKGQALPVSQAQLTDQPWYVAESGGWDESALGSVPATTPVGGHLAASTVYIAHTPEQAQTLRAWLAAGPSSVPAGAPAQAAVILAPSAAEAAFARDAVREAIQDRGVAPVVLDAATITGP